MTAQFVQAAAVGGANAADGDAQNPAGYCWQWMQSWMVRGSRPGAVTVCRRGMVVVIVGQFRSAGVALGVADGGRAGLQS